MVPTTPQEPENHSPKSFPHAFAIPPTISDIISVSIAALMSHSKNEAPPVLNPCKRKNNIAFITEDKFDNYNNSEI